MTLPAANCQPAVGLPTLLLRDHVEPFTSSSMSKRDRGWDRSPSLVVRWATTGVGQRSGICVGRSVELLGQLQVVAEHPPHLYLAPPRMLRSGRVEEVHRMDLPALEHDQVTHQIRGFERGHVLDLEQLIVERKLVCCGTPACCPRRRKGRPGWPPCEFAVTGDLRVGHLVSSTAPQGGAAPKPAA